MIAIAIAEYESTNLQIKHCSLYIISTTFLPNIKQYKSIYEAQ